ncbi:MAG: hypothetical protein AAF517_27975, partial [Planctomycetota bacterium]
TGAPHAKAWVLANVGSNGRNLARLKREDWAQLAMLPDRPSLDDPALATLRKQYGIGALVRTNESGEFRISQSRSEKLYALIAFDENHLPYRQRLSKLARNGGEIAIEDLPLFPAAKVVVQADVAKGVRLSIGPRWRLEPNGQPEGFEAFRAHDHVFGDRGFEYDHWMKRNEKNPVFVPARYRVRLRLDPSYSDEWAPADLAQTFQLTRGQVIDAGAVSFAKAFQVRVLVVDSKGRPIEGAPVRRRYKGGGAWCVAHNTDRSGLANLWAHPNSRGAFRVTDFPRRHAKARRAKNLGIEFDIGTEAPASPFRIQLTDEQLRWLFEPKKR